RFDDDATQHSFALPAGLSTASLPAASGTTIPSSAPPVAPADTSYDDLEVEPDAPTTGDVPAPSIGDAPIDDDLGVMPAGALAERRRIVVVAAVLSGAPADALRPVTKGLGELAYQRGGVVLALAPDALVVAFGLEVAGEDDVAIAMGWALDAAAMARDAA